MQLIRTQLLKRVVQARAFTVSALLILCAVLGFLLSPAAAQQTGSVEAKQSQQSSQEVDEKVSQHSRLSRRPIEWIIGPYIPIQEPLQPLTSTQRREIYVRQTFLTAGSYVARAFSAGIDQARGEPNQWGGGIPGYGRRYVARYGQFVIQNSLVAGGNALLGYEPRYDFCRCNGFRRRTLHAISRNFVAYNRTENDLRPQVPLYIGAFTAGVVYNSWLPGHQNLWRGGLYSALAQAGIGSGYNFVSEFALDILHSFGLKKEIKRVQ